MLQDDKQDLMVCTLPTCLVSFTSAAARMLNLSESPQIFCHAPSHLSALTNTTSVPGMFWFYSSSDKCLFFFPSSAKITSPVKSLPTLLSQERLAHSFLLCPQNVLSTPSLLPIIAFYYTVFNSLVDKSFKFNILHILQCIIS